MRRFFAKNLLFVISVNLLVKPLWIFMIDRTVQNTVGHEAYGPYQALLNLGIIFNILLDFGISNYNSKTIAQQPEKLNQLFPAMLSARLILSLLYVVIVLAIGWILQYRNWELWMLVGVLLIQALNSIVLYIRSNVSGLHKFRADGILSVTDRFLMIIICGILLYYPPFRREFRIEWFVLSQIVSYGIAIIIGLFLLKKISRVRIRFSVDLKEVMQVIKSSLPYALLIFLMSVYTRSDYVLIERLSGVSGRGHAGIYAHGYRLLDVGNMFGLMFASILLPLFGRMLSLKQSTQPIVQLSVNLLLPASLLVSVVSVFFSNEIIGLLYNDVTALDAQVFTWLMLSFPAFSLSNVYSTLLTANGYLKILNRIAFAGVIISLGLNFILIPQYFSLGAAVTTFFTQSILAVCFIVVARRRVQLSKDFSRVISFFIFLAIIIAAGYLIKLTPISWVVQVCILLALGAIAMSMFRFITIKSLLSLVSKD
jgi:O-antigen/teichoic acid export membrane protein